MYLLPRTTPVSHSITTARARNVDIVITFDDQSTRTTYLHPYTYLIMPGNALPRTYGEKENA